MMSNVVTLNNQLEEMKKLLSLISEMKDRKIKVEQRLIELSIKFLKKNLFIIIKFYLNLRREFQKSTSTQFMVQNNKTHYKTR